MSDVNLGIKAIARALDCSTDTVRRRFKQGKLPGAYQAGGKGARIKMSKADVEKLKEVR